MKKFLALLLAVVLAVGILGSMGQALPLVGPDQEAHFDMEAIVSGQAPAPVERSEWTDGTLNQVTADEADGSAYQSDWFDLEVPSSSTGSYLNDGGRAPIGTMVSFMDDDCRSEAYDILYSQVIAPMELPYTLSVPIDQLGRSGYVSSWQLQEMVDAGVSVACHTLAETSMAAYTREGLDAMLTQWRSEAQDLGLGEVLAYSYCNGVWSSEAMPAVKSHFRMGFTVDPGINEMPFESFYMKRVGLFANRAAVLEPDVRDGTYLNANGTLIRSTPGQRQTSGPIPVQEGEEYLLTCSAVWKGACYAVYNSSGKVIEKYNVPDTAAGALFTDLKVHIPAGAATLVVSHNLSVYGDTDMAVKKLPDKSTLHAAKAYVDQVARDGGWLVFMTHAWYPYFDPADLAELVDYIRSKDIPIVDVNEAIRTSGNVIEVGDFRKPPEYVPGSYFVVGADGSVFTNSLEELEVPENHRNVALTLQQRRVLLNGKSVSTEATATEYLVSGAVDVSDCEAVLITGWAYDHVGTGNSYQLYVIKDAAGTVLDQRTATHSYDEGGDLMDHSLVYLPDGAATIQIAGNIYFARPELTKIYPEG